MALAERATRKQPVGRPKPRIAPPTPARSQWRAIHEAAAAIGLQLWPWQDTANRYIYALGPDDRWLYAEVAALVGRQNGKTELLVPHIRWRLHMGRRITHTAQDRRLPREIFIRIAEIMWEHDRGMLISKPRFANGQEEIRLRNGGIYRIVAPTRSGFRGLANDDVIIDEVRELTDHDVIAAAKPTLSASPNPQTLYLSNAGDATSEVLNAIKRRSMDDPSLAYLEWSAAPERATDDLAGWLEANPAIGHRDGMLENLARDHRADLLGGTMAIFETEHLCRWVESLAPPIIQPGLWAAAEQPVGDPVRPVLGIAASETRISAVFAWQIGDRFALSIAADATGDPTVDLDAAGRDIVALGNRMRVSKVVYDPYDEHLARHFRKPVPMNGRDFANACGGFVNLLETGRLHWTGASAVGVDLGNATRKAVGPGAWMAVKAKEDVPITAALAAIRAVGAVRMPRPLSAPRIY